MHVPSQHVATERCLHRARWPARCQACLCCRNWEARSGRGSIAVVADEVLELTHLPLCLVVPVLHLAEALLLIGELVFGCGQGVRQLGSSDVLLHPHLLGVHQQLLPILQLELQLLRLALVSAQGLLRFPEVALDGLQPLLVMQALVLQRLHLDLGSAASGPGGRRGLLLPERPLLRRARRRARKLLLVARDLVHELGVRHALGSSAAVPRLRLRRGVVGALRAPGALRGQVGAAAGCRVAAGVDGLGAGDPRQGRRRRQLRRAGPCPGQVHASGEARPAEARLRGVPSEVAGPEDAPRVRELLLEVLAYLRGAPVARPLLGQHLKNHVDAGHGRERDGPGASTIMSRRAVQRRQAFGHRRGREGRWRSCA
mmetsp:Transcript_115592/g.338132  ORF Transcript_115592/g.338132 Transcript_115592/m.338132 type:complete len:371 (-) Transcript_115592:14-1126(-)